MSAIYRGGKLGDSLVEALDVLVTEGKIDGDLAQRVLESVRGFISVSSSSSHGGGLSGLCINLIRSLFVV